MIRVRCSRAPRAIVAESAPHTHRELNLVDDVELQIVEEMPGYDLAPVIVPAGCGYQFEIPDEPWRWDVNTVLAGERELVVERHLAVPCPRCGGTADFLSVPIADPYEFLHQGMSKRERLILSDPALGELLDDLEPGKAARILDRLLAAARGLIADDSGSSAIYAHVSEGAVALSAATAKSIIGAKAGSAVGLMATGYEIGFDGVTASAVPVLIEYGYCTWASNAPGTNSTGTTERQKNGRVISADWTGGRNWTTEPTTITVLSEKLLSPNGGLVIYDEPLGKEADSAVSEGFVIRCNAPAAVNVRATQQVAHL